MHWRIPPSLIEEPSCSIQMLEIVFVGLGTPEFHIRNLEVAPEVARAVPVGLNVVVWSSRTIHNPLSCIIRMLILGMRCHELLCLWPQGRYTLWRIVEIYSKSIGFIVILHPPKDIVVDFTEEMHFGLNAPIVANVLERRVFVEHATVPAAHLVVGYHRAILDFLLFQHLSRFVKQIAVYPVGNCPVLLRYDLCRYGMLASGVPVGGWTDSTSVP
jgi:hypothetical protein